MNIAYLGNFDPPFSTENEIRKALEHLDHRVATFQENEKGIFITFDPAAWDMVLWTHTQDSSRINKHSEQHQMLRKARKAKVPVVGYHLDRWWGLSREHLVYEEPFFNVDLLCTADGGHDDSWEAIGVNHRWFPPAVSEFECVPGTYREEYASDIAFIGGWQSYGHPEATHRPALVSWLKENYGNQVRFWPEQGQPAIREEKLRDVIASTKIIVGDSCITDWLNECCYWSDRIPETLGRGGFLLHPYVNGLFSEQTEYSNCVIPWQAWNWAELRNLIDLYLDADQARHSVQNNGQWNVKENHTYTRRMEQLFELMQQEGML